MFRKIALLAVAVLLVIPASLTSVSAAESRTLTVMHTNSTLNRIQEFKPFRQTVQGGAPRRATVIKQIREENPDALLLSAGGDVMGTPMFAQYGGVASGEIMALLGYDAALVSQIDLMAGGSLDGFKGYQSVINYPLVNSNLDLSKLEGIDIPENTVLTKGDLKIGVFGMASERAVSLGNFAGSIALEDTDEVVQANLEQFKEDNVDIVIMLSALGVERDRYVAEKYGSEGIDLIVGNAQSTILGDPKDLPEWEVKPIGPYPLVFNEKTAPTLVVYAHEFGSYLGELNMTFNEEGVLESWNGKMHFLGEEIKPDPDVQERVDELAAGVAMEKIVVGETTVDLHGSYQEYPWKENPLGNIYADAFLQYGAPFGAKIALVNGGAVWGSIPKGKITVGDLYRVQPFFNWLVVLDVTGEQLEAALENGVSGYGGEVQTSGRFLHVAGMTYTYDPSKEVGERVTEVMIDGEPLDPEGVYSIVVNSFMADGGDDFKMLREGTNIFNTGLSVTDILQQYVEANSPLEMPVMDRITEVGKK